MDQNTAKDRLIEIMKIGKEMREAQAEYFKAAVAYRNSPDPKIRDRKNKYLSESKRLERQFDDLIRANTQDLYQKRLF